MITQKPPTFWNVSITISVVANLLIGVYTILVQFPTLIKETGPTAFLFKISAADRDIYHIWGVIGVLTVSVIVYLLSLRSALSHRPYKRLAALTYTAGLVGALPFYKTLTGEFNTPIAIAIVALGPAAPFLLILGLEWLIALIFRGLAKGATAMSRWSMACRLLRVASAFGPTNKAVRKDLGITWFELEQFDRARPLLQERFDDGDRDSDLLEALNQISTSAAPKQAIEITEVLVERNPKRKDLIEKLIDLYREIGESKKALGLIERHHSLETIEGLWRAEAIIAEEGDVNRALQLITKAVSIEDGALLEARRRAAALLNTYPDNLDILRTTADLAQRLNDAKNAIAHLEHLCILSPNDAPARLNLIRLYRTSGRMDETLPHYKLLFNQAPPTPDLQVEYIDTLESLGHEQEAYREVRKIRAQPTDDPRLLKRAAAMLFERDELDQARECVERGIKAAPGAGDPYGFSALSTSIARKIAGRNLEALRRRRTAEPKNIDLFFEYVDQLIESDHITRAITELDTILNERADVKLRVMKELRRITEGPEPPYEAMSYHADLLLREDNYEDALALFKKMAAQALNPDNVLREGCQQVLRIHPDYLEAHLALAQIAENDENWRELTERLQACERIDRAAFRPHLPRLFKACYELKDLSQCRVYGNAVITNNPHEISNYHLLAEVLMENEQYKEALELISRGRNVDRTNRQLISLQKEATEKARSARMTELRDLFAREGSEPNCEQHLEMGNLLVEVENLKDAITQYHQAKNDSALANLCRTKIAYCLACKQMFDLASETLEEIDWGKKSEKHIDEIKALIFNTAVIFEEDHLFEQAHEFYKRVFKIDAGYRNVVERIEDMTQRIARQKARRPGQSLD